MGDLQLHETLHKRADTALSIVGKIRSTLDGEMEEDILSSARIKAKEPGHIMALSKFQMCEYISYITNLTNYCFLLPIILGPTFLHCGFNP